MRLTLQDFPRRILKGLCVRSEGSCGHGDEREGCGGPARRRKTGVGALRRGRVQGRGNTGEPESELIYLWISDGSTLFMLVHGSSAGALILIPSFERPTSPRGTERAKVSCERRSGVCVCMCVSIKTKNTKIQKGARAANRRRDLSLGPRPRLTTKQ